MIMFETGIAPNTAEMFKIVLYVIAIIYTPAAVRTLTLQF